MIIKEIAHGLHLASATEGYIRTPGLHASDLYGPYYDAVEGRERKKWTNNDDDVLPVEIGTAFEELLEPVLMKRLLGERPGEHIYHLPDCTKVGNKWCKAHCIIFSPDWLFYEGGKRKDTVLGEFKCTRKSSRGAPNGKKFAQWVTQIKLYLFFLKLTKARLFVLFINGGYKPPLPQLKCWEMEFTPGELEEEWGIVSRFATEEGLLG